MSNRTLVVGVAVALAISASPVFAQQSCESLSTLKLSGVTVTSAATIAAGPLAGPAGPGGGANAATVPARCEVKLTIRPSKDSEIKSAVWLPINGWNGKYQQVGNGGWAGNIGYRAMVDPLTRGYAAAASDDGHEGGGGAAWAEAGGETAACAASPATRTRGVKMILAPPRSGGAY